MDIGLTKAAICTGRRRGSSIVFRCYEIFPGHTASIHVDADRVVYHQVVVESIVTTSTKQQN
jgi:hypothetical protein